MRVFSLFITLICLFSFNLNGQIVFNKPFDYKVTSDSSFFDISSTRKIIMLNGNWNVYKSGDEDKNLVPVVIPSVFQGEGDLIFERQFNISKTDHRNNKFRLHFLGLNYTADISVNNRIIYRHTGGDYPFTLDLPKDILTTDKPNVLSVKLVYKLDSDYTIPVKQRFLFPKNLGGIFRDVFIHLEPNISVSEYNVNYFRENGRVKLNIYTKIDNKNYTAQGDSSAEMDLNISIYSPDGSLVQEFNRGMNVKRNTSAGISQSFVLSTPLYWTPDNPRSYKVKISLSSNNYIFDVTRKSLAILLVEPGVSNFLLNGESFPIHGVTFIPSSTDRGILSSYPEMERDIKIIKEAGFNAVRFTNATPHPYYLSLCEKLGLIAFIELPLNYIPAGITSSETFVERSTDFLNGFIKAYKSYTAIGAIGIGSSYLIGVDRHVDFIEKLTKIVKSNSRFKTYASFADLGYRKIENLDFYGFEIINQPLEQIHEQLTSVKEQLGAGNVFLSSATYIVNRGNSDGYSTPNTYEAQAKYFEELIDYSHKYNLPGYFINSMFDYRGDFTSLTSGFNTNNVYNIGIISEDRQNQRQAYRVIYAKLHNTEKVTIPIGTKKDSAPMVFIIFGIALAILMGILINSGRKFREDTSRALLRPYNFYSDVRDQRLISGYHTIILSIVLSAISGLLLSNLLYYFKDSIAFERYVLAFGSRTLIYYLSFLAWNPVYSLIILSFLTFAAFVALTICVKIGSLFVRNIVFFSGSFFTVIWSFLPMVLLIPVGIVLFRILAADITNIYIFLALLVFTIWIFYRLMKGIYVIYDVRPGTVYFYGILFLMFIAGSFILYFHFTNSLVDYISLTFSEFKIG